MEARTTQDIEFNPATPSRQVIEAASWRLAAEVFRRYPLSLRIIETHPGDGQYDCLTLLSTDPFTRVDHIDLNRAGSVFVLPREASDLLAWRGAWSEMVSTHDPKALLDRLCEMAGLTPAEVLPPSTHASITYRMIAAFVSHAPMGLTVWECRNGFPDDGWLTEPRDWFALFPGAAERLRQRHPEDLLNQPAYRFWFLTKDGEPRLALEPSTGRAWDLDGRESNVLDVYRANARRIWPVVWHVAGHLLP